MPIRTFNRTVITIMFFFFRMSQVFRIGKELSKKPHNWIDIEPKRLLRKYILQIVFFLIYVPNRKRFSRPANCNDWNSTRADRLTFTISTLTVIVWLIVAIIRRRTDTKPHSPDVQLYGFRWRHCRRRHEEISLHGNCVNSTLHTYFYCTYRPTRGNDVFFFPRRS